MRYQAIFGILILIGIAWAFGENRRKVSITAIVTGLAVQFAMALLLIRLPSSRHLFEVLNQVVAVLEESTKAGTSFVFGYLGGAPLPFDAKTPGAGFVLALQALPVVLVVSALSSLLPWCISLTGSLVSCRPCGVSLSASSGFSAG